MDPQLVSPITLRSDASIPTDSLEPEFEIFTIGPIAAQLSLPIGTRGSDIVDALKRIVGSMERAELMMEPLVGISSIHPERDLVIVPSTTAIRARVSVYFGCLFSMAWS